MKRITSDGVEDIVIGGDDTELSQNSTVHPINLNTDIPSTSTDYFS